MSGDLCPESQIYFPVDHLINRSAFLGSPQMYGYFSAIHSKNADFWYAISTGIPEIQAHAFVNLLDLPHGNVAETLSSLNDASAIPWTPQLDAEIRRILNMLRKSSIHSSYIEYLLPIYGAILDEIQDPVKPSIYANYLRHLILRSLGGREVVGHVEIIDQAIKRRPPNMNPVDLQRTLIENGYLTYVIISTDQAQIQAMANTGLESISYNVLLWVSQTPEAESIVFSSEADIRYRYGQASSVLKMRTILHARAILDNANIRSMMREEVLSFYKMLAAESGVTRETEALIQETGVPITWVPDGSDAGSHAPALSVQGSKMIDAPYAANVQNASQQGKLALRMVFLRGQASQLTNVGLLREAPEVVNAITRPFIGKKAAATYPIPDYPLPEDLPIIQEAKSRDPIAVKEATKLVGTREQKYQQMLTTLTSPVHP